MILKDFRSQAQPDLVRGELTLEGASLGDGRLARLMSIADNTLSLKDVTVTRDEPTHLFVNGRAVTPLLGQNGLSVALELTEEGGQLELRATISGQNEGWRFKDTFPDTRHSLLDGLNYRQVRWIFDTRPPAQGELLGGPPDLAAPGRIVFHALVGRESLSADLCPLVLPADAADLTLSGPIARYQGATWVRLAAAERGHLDSGALSFQTGLLLVSGRPGEMMMLAPWAFGVLVAERSLQLSGSEATLTFEAAFPGLSPTLLSLCGQPQDRPSVSLSAIEGILGGSQENIQWPTELPGEDKLSLHEVLYIIDAHDGSAGVDRRHGRRGE